MVIGWFGYAKGSAEGNIIAETSDTGMLSPVESTNVVVNGVGGNDWDGPWSGPWLDGILKFMVLGVVGVGVRLGAVSKYSELRCDPEEYDESRARPANWEWDSGTG